MKKILVTLLVLALCAPAMAATVGFVDNADGTGTFTITATELIVGVGLDVDATASVTAVAITPADFNIYPDAAYTLDPGYTYGAGGPVAAKTVPGEISLPQTSFALSFGNLNGAATAGADGANVVTVTFSAADGTQVTIGENATRGGVVGTLGEDIDLTGTLVGTITDGPGECVNSGAAFYADWLAFGSPDCWCYAAQCLGDANGAQEGSAFAGFKKVFNADLTQMLAGYGVKEPPKGPGIATITDGICADFNHAQEGSAFAGFKRVFNADLTILLAAYGVKEPPKGPGIGDCTGPDYNFFITP